jgi:hypothetical protein
VALLVETLHVQWGGQLTITQKFRDLHMFVLPSIFDLEEWSAPCCSRGLGGTPADMNGMLFVNGASAAADASYTQHASCTMQRSILAARRHVEQ